MSQLNRRTPSPLEQVRRRHRVGVAAPSASRGDGVRVRKTLSKDDEKLLNQVLAEEQDFIDSPAFYEPGAEKKIYDEAPEIAKPDTTWYHPVMDDLSSSSRTRTVKSAQQVILTGAEEKVLFHQFNYARYRVRELQKAIEGSDTRQPTPDQAQSVLDWFRRSERIREQIAETNLALVLAMAKRTRMSEVDFADLVSEGNMALLRAVDKFDAGRGYKFSTYACRAILKSFSRVATRTARYRGHFPTEFDPTLEKSNHQDERRRVIEDACVNELRAILGSNVANLNEVEKQVILARFAIDPTDTEDPPRAKTLEQVGEMIGVTKERVRQIQNKALNKLKTLLEDGVLAL